MIEELRLSCFFFFFTFRFLKFLPPTNLRIKLNSRARARHPPDRVSLTCTARARILKIIVCVDAFQLVNSSIALRALVWPRVCKFACMPSFLSFKRLFVHV